MSKPHQPAGRPRRQRKAKKAASPVSLAAHLGVPMLDEDLLLLALTHSSWANEQTEGVTAPGGDNERLEFLGDAVLGLAVTDALCREFQGVDEGTLTRLRSHLVSQPQMASAAVAMDLPQRLRLGRSAEISGVRGRAAVLADTAEAVLAAVYVSAGLPAAAAVVERFILAPERAWLLSELREGNMHDALRDAKTLLQERVQASGLGQLRYTDAGQSGPAHQLSFRVEAHLVEPHHVEAPRMQAHLAAATGDDAVAAVTHVLGAAEGPSKKEAQQRAARLALDGWHDFVKARGGPAPGKRA